MSEAMQEQPSSARSEGFFRGRPPQPTSVSEPDLYLTVAVEDFGDIRCIRLAGELDLSQLPTLRAELAFGNAAIVEVDLTHLRLMDATGLSALLSAKRRGLREGRSIRLVGPQGIVRKLFALLDLDHELDE